MKIAIIGSRNLIVENLEKYIPNNCEEIVSGGADGVDKCAKDYANKLKIDLKEFFPEYNNYGRSAPIVRNKMIVDYSDEVIAFWNGESKGTKSVIDYCKKKNKKCTVIICKNK